MSGQTFSQNPCEREKSQRITNWYLKAILEEEYESACDFSCV